MSWRLLAVAAFVTAGLAGCIEQPATPVNDPALAPGSLLGTLGIDHLLFAGKPLWNDPQNTPHPKWGWATLSSPPDGILPPAWRPINGTPLPDHIQGLKLAAKSPPEVFAGAGIALFGSIAVVPEDRQMTHIVDISQPLHPRELGQVESHGRGAAIIAFPDGRLVAASATTPGFDVIDFTDPAHPVVVNQTEVPVNGGHKLGVVPGTPILYNAGSGGGDPGVAGQPHPLYGPGLCNADISQCTGYTEIYNLTDPAHPRLVQNFQNGLACHHIFFWNAPDGSRQRAVCAGIQYTQLWDTADPEHPKVLVSLPVHTGVPGTPSQMASVAAFSHSAGLNTKGNILYVGDENMGGGLPPGCLAGTATPSETPFTGTPVPAGGTDAGTPVGATWFYDVSDEQSPRLLGYFAPPRDADHNTERSCTTHHGRIVPDKEGRDLLAMSYYQDGVILVDFTGVDAAAGVLPKVVDEFSSHSDTWETWYYDGYLFTGDLARGMDVLAFR
ncbi:MAG: hypothetical protein LC623_06100 [Halobacteriales archaeon]|nr:hypothetical protein [Halobacteriales archaeon]